MEYAVPAAAGPDCVREIRELITRRRWPVSFPLEIRTVAADDFLLSPFHGRDSVTIAVHMYRPVDHRPLFDAVEAIFQNHAGRPHWGKKHSAPPAYLRRVYPRWDDFLAVRQELDPQGRFASPYLQSLFLAQPGPRRRDAPSAGAELDRAVRPAP
jgi:L-gulonolactone oxidase